MPKDALKKTFKEIMNQTQPIISTALINGATRVSNELNVAVSGVNQSPRILFGKITSILRNGAIATGQEVMKNGLENVKKNLD